LSELIALGADVAAAWHTAWLTALGLRSERTDRVWRALDPPPFIYLTAITLSDAARAEDLAGQPGALWDAWSAVDLTPYGYAATAREPWFIRTPAPLDLVQPPELEILPVRTPPDVEEFERTSMRGFREDESANVETGSIHPASILSDSRMSMLTGRVDGRPVAAAMSYSLDDVVGIFGVTTIPSARRRGYGSALTRALVDPRLPAALTPSAMAERLYRRLGFERIGELTMWQARTPRQS
jgi:ribosomal protein S18 acetylase RimI-like enzyme